MSLIESRDILNKLCSNDYYRGDDVQCAIQCLAEGKTIGRVRTLEDVGQTVIDEKLKDDLMKSKDKWDVPDNMKWLLPLLFFPPASDPPRREISVTANVNGKSVVITYDPHDPEAAKAADVWRKTLFAEPPKDALDNLGYFWERDSGASLLRWRERPDEDAKPICRMHYDGTVTNSFYVTVISPDGSPLVTNGYISATTLPQAKAMVEAMIAVNLQTHCAERLRAWKPMLPAEVEAAKTHVAELRRVPPTTADDTRELDFAIRELSGIAKDNRKGWDAYFDSVNITHVIEWLKQFRETMDGKPAAEMTELEKAAKPLRDYLKAHGDPHTSVIVTQDGATVKQDERGVKFDNEMTLAQCLQNAYDSLEAEPQSQKHGTWQETLLRILDTHMARRNSLNVPLQVTLPSEVVVSLRNWILGNAS